MDGASETNDAPPSGGFAVDELVRVELWPARTREAVACDQLRFGGRNSISGCIKTGLDAGALDTRRVAPFCRPLRKLRKILTGNLWLSHSANFEMGKPIRACMEFSQDKLCTTRRTGICLGSDTLLETAI